MSSTIRDLGIRVHRTLTAHRPDLRPRTRELYDGLLAHHILPRLGSVEIAKLSASQVRSWHAELRGAAGPGASTTAKAYRLLRAILNAAVADAMIVRNPCQVERAGVERAPERPVPTIAEVEALAEAIAPRLRALVLLASWCGLRRGELTGLQRRDIDLERGTVTVERAMSQLADGTLVMGPPKTDAGRRSVAIPPHVIPDLTDHLHRFVATVDDGLVFTGEKGGPLRPHVLQTAWVRAKEATGLPRFHLHDLRHAGNTWAAATGASTRELMSRMGHASSEAALRYQHATADRDRVIAASLSELARAERSARAGAEGQASNRAETARGRAGAIGHDRTRDKRAMDLGPLPLEDGGMSL